ncbi:MAG: hypothetical protein J1E04_02230 [Alistipes sp.]|nr:hypothetical protein [Alistipes sp.]
MSSNAAGRRAVENIDRQVGRLLKEHDRVILQRDALAAECGKLREQNRSLREEVKRLESELSAAQVVGGLTGDGGNRKRARARINRLLREVDRCIAVAGGNIDE